MFISGRSAGSASSTVFFIETQLRVASPTGRPEPAIYPKHATATEKSIRMVGQPAFHFGLDEPRDRQTRCLGTRRYLDYRRVQSL